MKSRRLTQRSQATIYYRRSDLVRHSKAWLRMSALGQEQTLRQPRSMSAIPPKADIRTDDRDVRFGPSPDSCVAAIVGLFDHLVGRTRSDSGTVSPSALAVLRVTASSNLAGRSTGRADGLMPPKNRRATTPQRRNR